MFRGLRGPPEHGFFIDFSLMVNGFLLFFNPWGPWGMDGPGDPHGPEPNQEPTKNQAKNRLFDNFLIGTGQNRWSP